MDAIRFDVDTSPRAAATRSPLTKRRRNDDEELETPPRKLLALSRNGSPYKPIPNDIIHDDIENEPNCALNRRRSGLMTKLRRKSLKQTPQNSPKPTKKSKTKTLCCYFSLYNPKTTKNKRKAKTIRRNN